MTTIPTQRPPDPVVPDDDDLDIYMWTDEEFEALKQKELDELGITHEELARQARENDYQSGNARALWIHIGP